MQGLNLPAMQGLNHTSCFLGFAEKNPRGPYVHRRARETLESVSSCTRFSGFLTISSVGFNRLSSKLVGMFFGIVPMFVLKHFVSDCFLAQICANYSAHAHFGAYLRGEAIPNKILSYEHWNYPKEHAYQFLAQTVKSEARYRRKTWKSSA